MQIALLAALDSIVAIPLMGLSYVQRVFIVLEELRIILTLSVQLATTVRGEVPSTVRAQLDSIKMRPEVSVASNALPGFTALVISH